MDCSTPGSPVLHYLPEFAQIHVYWVGDAIQPSQPLLLPSPAFNLSQHQGLFQWVSSSYQVANVLELQPQAYSRLISFRMDWLDLAVQGTLKSLLQHHSLKASFLQIKLLKRSLAHWGIKWIHGSVFLSYLITIYYFGIYFYIAIL